MLRSRADLEAAQARAGDRIAFETLLLQAYGEADEWYLPGFCQVCDTAVALLADRRYAPQGGVNFRERLLCPTCELNNRQRFMAYIVRTGLDARPGETRTYLHEQVTPFFAWAAFSIPFHAGSDTTVKRAELRDGEVVELLPPEYHGNPMSDKGSLVFYDHGWDVLDRLRDAGFGDAQLLGYWSGLYGYLGNGLQRVFVATT